MVVLVPVISGPRISSVNKKAILEDCKLGFPFLFPLSVGLPKNSALKELSDENGSGS